MAAAPIAGVSGAFGCANVNGRFAQFTLTSVQDVNDASGFGLTDNWRANLGGMKGYRVSASGYVVSNAATTAPDVDFGGTGAGTGVTWTGTFVAVAGGTCTVSGTLIPTSLLVAHGINGNGTFSLEGIGTGPLVESWDEA